MGAQATVVPSTISTSYCGITRGNFVTTSELAGSQCWSAAGSFDNLLVTISTAPGSGKSYAFTLVINGTPSSLTVTISDLNTTARLTGTSVSVAAGDRLTLKCVPSGTPASMTNCEFTIEFVGSVSNQSGYGFPIAITSNSAARYQGALLGTSWFTTNGAGVRDVVSIAGTLTRLDVLQSAASGVGKTYTYVINKNGTPQDGTSGTPNTTVTISGNSATTGSATFSLSLSAGDTIEISCTPTSTPSTVSAGCSVAFTSTVGGYAMMPGSNGSAPSTGSTNYAPPQNIGASWGVAEGSNDVTAAITTVTLSKLYVELEGSPGSGKNYTYSYRRNTTSPGGTPSVQVADAATTGNDTSNSIAIADGDVWTIRSVPSGTPTARKLRWNAAQFAAGNVSGSPIIHYARMMSA
jgi:hypothetical protein